MDVEVSGAIDVETGMIINPEELNGIVGAVLEGLDYKRLDIEVPYFKENQPTGENIAKYLWDEIKEDLGERLVYIRVGETKNSCFEYYEETNYPL